MPSVCCGQRICSSRIWPPRDVIASISSCLATESAKPGTFSTKMKRGGVGMLSKEDHLIENTFAHFFNNLHKCARGSERLSSMSRRRPRLVCGWHGGDIVQKSAAKCVTSSTVTPCKKGSSEAFAYKQYQHITWRWCFTKIPRVHFVGAGVDLVRGDYLMWDACCCTEKATQNIFYAPKHKAHTPLNALRMPPIPVNHSTTR